MSVGLRRNLLCFATGALIALAAVLIVREGDDGTPDAAATGAPARVATTETTAARAVPRSVRLRTKHLSPGQGRRRGAGGGGAATSSSSASSAGAARTGGAGTSASAAGPAPHARPSRTTPESDAGTTAPPDADHSPDTGGADPAGGAGGQATDPAAPAPDAADGTQGAASDPGVTIPNAATPDASVGSG